MQMIAETAWHHEGDFNFFKKLVHTIGTDSKTDIIKIHITLDFDEYMSSDHFLYRKAKEWLLNKKEWEEIIRIISDSDKKVMMLFNDTSAIKFGMFYEPELVEIHSTCLNDVKILHTLKMCVSPKTKIVVGIGGTTMKELKNAINFINHKNIVFMHGFQNFPTKYSDINFNKIRKIMGLYPGFKHGYADHTAWDEPNNLLVTLLGAAQGMSYIEKHVTTVYGEDRNDWQSAISIEMFNELCEKVQVLNECFGNGKLDLNNAEKEYSVYGPMKKAALLNRNIKKGDIFSLDLIDFKRTSQITDLSQSDVIESVGKQFSCDIKKDQVLKKTHFIV